MKKFKQEMNTEIEITKNNEYTDIEKYEIT